MKAKGKPEWPECPFRAIRPSATETGAEGTGGKVVCEAAGDAILGDAGKGLNTNPFCPVCDIPRLLAHPRACLYLVPFRVFQDGRAKSYYACRWRLDFKPFFFPENIDWCRACRHWFPRPPEHLVFHQLEFTRRALELYLSPAAPYVHPALKDYYLPVPDDGKNWYRALCEKVRGLIRRRR